MTQTPSSDIPTIATEPSPGTHSSERLSHVSREYLSNIFGGSQQDAVEIADRVLSPQNSVSIMLEIYDLISDSTEAASSKVA
jgi:hypothetical protein